jgi:hypothetical protein
MTLVHKLIVVICLLALAFGAGWRTKAAFVAERDLAIVEAKQEFIDAYQVAESGKAKILEDKLADLRANERIIEREKYKIIDRPVYLNNCLDIDGLRLVESARTGKANTGQPADEMPGAK